MAGTVSTKIELDGGKSFAQALKDIALQAKVLDSEMRAAASSIDDEADAQTKARKQSELLTTRIEEQRKVVERLKAVMEDSAKQNGENSATTQRAKVAYNDAVTALNNLEKQLDETTDQVQENTKVTEDNTKTQVNWKEGFQNVGKGIATTAKAIAGATAAIAAAAVAAGKAIWDMANDVAATGDEIDKMSQKIGISAQAYQEWSYVFERSGTDVEKLREGMKTLSSVIVEAGNGADSANDKLSAVGLTIEELNGLSQEDQLALVIESLQGMEAGAERTAAANALLGESATEMAAVLNMTAEDTQALKDEAHDYGMVMSDEAVAASAAFEDSLTRLQGTLGGVKNEMTSGLLPALTELMDGFSMLVSGQDGADKKIASGTSGIVSSVSSMVPQVVSLIGTLGQAILTAAPTLLTNLADGIVQNLPTLVTTAIDVILTLVDALLNGESLTLLLDGALQIISHLAEGLIANLPLILSSAMSLIGELLQGLADGIPQLIDMAIELVFAILDGLTDPESLKNMITGALHLVVELAKGLVSAIPEIAARLPEIIASIVKTLIELAPELITSAIEIIAQLIVGLIQAIPTLVAMIPDIINSIKDTFDGFDWGQIGTDIMNGIKNGLSNMVSTLINKVKEIGQQLLNSAKKVLGIASPSKEFAKVGNYIGEGLDQGMTKSLKMAAQDMQDQLKAMPVNASATLNAVTGSGSTRNFAFGNVSFNVYAQEGQDAETIARRVEEIFMSDIRAREEAFA